MLDLLFVVSLGSNSLCTTKRYLPYSVCTFTCRLWPQNYIFIVNRPNRSLEPIYLHSVMTSQAVSEVYDVFDFCKESLIIYVRETKELIVIENHN